MQTQYIIRNLLFLIAVILFGVVGFNMMEAKPEQTIRNGYIPLLPGDDQILPLRHAMARDERLNTAVLDLGTRTAMQIFADYTTTDYLVSTILLHWTGSHEVKAGVRGEYVDSRIVDFLEKTGNARALPAVIYDRELAANIRRKWYEVFQLYKAKLLLQTSARDVFRGTATYSMQSDTIAVSGDLSERFMQEFIDLLSFSENPKAMYSNLIVFLRNTKGFDRMTPSEQELLRSARNVAEGRDRLRH